MKKSCKFWTTFKHLFLIKNCRLPEGAARGSSPLLPCHATVHKLFSVVDVSGPQVLQAVRRAEHVAVEDYMIGRLLLSATDAFRCI